MKKIVKIFIALLLSVIGGTVLSAIFGINPVMASAGVLGANVLMAFIPLPENVACGLIFTAPGGVGTPFAFNMTYLPEFFFYNHAGNQLTSLRVETQEDGVIFNLPAAGLTAINAYGKIGAQVANDMIIRLADGRINGKNVTVSGVTAAVGAIGIYEFSDNRGVAPFETFTAQILALQPTEFSKFTALFIPTMATGTDFALVEFLDGHTQRFAIEELSTMSSFRQEVQGIILDNSQAYIKRAIFTCAAATPVYVIRVKV